MTRRQRPPRLPGARIEWLGDAAVALRLDAPPGRGTSAQVLALAERLAAARLAQVSDIVPGYASVTLAFSEDAVVARAEIDARLAAVLAEADAAAPRTAARELAVPVVYGGEHGPDLVALATHAGLAPDEVVARHASAEYVVAMVGFLPGFPYLIGLDPALAMPRRATPRARVPGGSVAIGASHTGIYPFDVPGGWHLIGRTPARLFDPAATPPALMAPGDRVRFRPIDAAEFARATIEVRGA